MLHDLMSGHSHWAGIKQRKGVNDAKRGKIFTKYGKLVTIAARDGGGKMETNFQLRMAVDRAREMNMPKENIERAIKRGTGEIKGAMIEEILYEAVGPGEVGFAVKERGDAGRQESVKRYKNGAGILRRQLQFGFGPGRYDRRFCAGWRVENCAQQRG